MRNGQFSNNNSNNNNKQRMRGGRPNRGGGGGGGRGPNPLSRSYESNGPDMKVRGTAQHVAEKYLQLARDAHSSGDHVMAESYLQHAEHYLRIIASAHEFYRQQAGLAEGQVADDDSGGDDDDDSLSMIDRRFEMPAMPQRPERAEQPSRPERPERSGGYGQQPRFERQPRIESEQGEGGEEQPGLEAGEGSQPRESRRDRFERERRERFERRNQRFERLEGAEGEAPVIAQAVVPEPEAEREVRPRVERPRRERFERPRRDPIEAEGVEEASLGLPAFITGAAVPVAVAESGEEGVLRTRRRRGKFTAKESSEGDAPGAAE